VPETQFLIAVTPRDGALSEPDRTALDGAMAGQGFRHWVTVPSGSSYLLPPGLYQIAGGLSRLDALGRARRAAAAVGIRFTVVVAEAAAIVWSGLDAVPDGVPGE
jgi:hypothetical protein